MGCERIYLCGCGCGGGWGDVYRDVKKEDREV